MRATADPATDDTSPRQTDDRPLLALTERLADAIDLALDAPTWWQSTDILMDASDLAHHELGRLRRLDGAA